MSYRVLPVRFSRFQVYSEIPGAEYVLYHLRRDDAVGSEPRFLRVYLDGKWELMQNKLNDSEPVESSDD